MDLVKLITNAMDLKGYRDHNSFMVGPKLLIWSKWSWTCLDTSEDDICHSVQIVNRLAVVRAETCSDWLSLFNLGEQHPDYIIDTFSLSPMRMRGDKFSVLFEQGVNDVAD